MGPDLPQGDIESLRQWKFFQGLDGIPFRTQGAEVPYYKADDPLHKQPKLVADMHVKQFDLNDAEQSQELEGILDRCAKGKSYLSQKETHFDDKVNGWRILLIWGDYYLEDPKETEIRNAEDRQNFS
jgi:hypothetical protein